VAIRPLARLPSPTAAPEEPKKPKSPVAQLQGRVGHLTKTIHQKDEALGEAQKQIDAYKALLAAQGRAPEGEGLRRPSRHPPQPSRQAPPNGSPPSARKPPSSPVAKPSPKPPTASMTKA
jgi:hypothetical protein